MTAKAKVDWELLAQVSARDACENNFSSRRGIYYYEDADVLCVYNNNPYAENPSLRDIETKKFRGWLKQQGIKELAYATYPKTGDDAGYTYAMLLDVHAERQEEVAEAMEAIIMESWERSESVR